MLSSLGDGREGGGYIDPSINDKKFLIIHPKIDDSQFFGLSSDRKYKQEHF